MQTSMLASKQKVHAQLIISSGHVNQFEWQELLIRAINPDLKTVVLNNHEYNISCYHADITTMYSDSIAGKLLAVLYNRFLFFEGEVSKGLRIINEQITIEELFRLECIVLELAHLNNLNPVFIDWLEANTYFCNSIAEHHST